jgi:hypothetical protein
VARGVSFGQCQCGGTSAQPAGAVERSQEAHSAIGEGIASQGESAGRSGGATARLACGVNAFRLTQPSALRYPGSTRPAASSAWGGQATGAGMSTTIAQNKWGHARLICLDTLRPTFRQGRRPVFGQAFYLDWNFPLPSAHPLFVHVRIVSTVCTSTEPFTSVRYAAWRSISSFARLRYSECGLTRASALPSALHR